MWVMLTTSMHALVIASAVRSTAPAWESELLVVAINRTPSGIISEEPNLLSLTDWANIGNMTSFLPISSHRVVLWISLGGPQLGSAPTKNSSTIVSFWV